MSKCIPATPAPAPLEGYCEHFDDLFTKRAQREGLRRYLEALLLPRERNKTLTALANTEPVSGACDAAAQRLQWFLSESTWSYHSDEIGTVREAALAAGAHWKSATGAGPWEAVERRFRDGHTEIWWTLEAQCGPFGAGRHRRLVVATTDPTRLPDQSTWYLETHLPRPSASAAPSAVSAADCAEVVRLYGLRNWVEQGYKQVKHELGWADYQVRSDAAIRRHWALVCCAFSFCWWALPPEAELAEGDPAPAAASHSGTEDSVPEREKNSSRRSRVG